jgi:PAS domain S-box-containing protein
MGLFGRRTKAGTENVPNGGDTANLIIKAISDGVVMLDGTGAIKVINPSACEITGWSAGEAYGLNYLSVIRLVDDKDAEVKDAGGNPIAGTLATRQARTTEALFLRTKSGKKINVDVSVSPVSSTEDAGVIVVFRDITQRKQSEEEKNNFISTASHEMRTPVAVIEGYLGMLLNPKLATIDERARGYVEKAHENSQHLGDLFQDLLDTTKLDDGRMEQNLEPVNAVEFAQEVVESLQAKAASKNLQLSLAMGGQGAAAVMPIFYVMADKNHLLEVVDNVVDNAIKYTETGGVEVSVDGDANRVRFMIRDSGIGIAPEDVPHLFQKFYRVNNSDTREIGGTGLGLYIVRKMVEAMNGRVWVESALGQGSTFYVELPRVLEEQRKLFMSQAAALQVQNPVQITEATADMEGQGGGVANQT